MTARHDRLVLQMKESVHTCGADSKQGAQEQLQGPGHGRSWLGVSSRVSALQRCACNAIPRLVVPRKRTDKCNAED